MRYSWCSLFWLFFSCVAGLLLLPVRVWVPYSGEQGVRSHEGKDTGALYFKKKSVWGYRVRGVKVPQGPFSLALLKLAVTAGMLWLARSALSLVTVLWSAALIDGSCKGRRPSCLSTSQAAKFHLQIFSFPVGVMALQVMLLSPFQVSCLVRIFLVGQMGSAF